MESEYQSVLDPEAKTQYAVPDEEWMDDITKWPSVEYGDIYNYLIDSKGRYAKDSLKAYKSLEAYNYFVSGHVRTVYFYESAEQSKYVVLMAEVNPSQKSPNNPHKAWVIIHKEDGQIMSGHCKCKAG